MSKPGDIIPEAKISSLDSHGKCWVKINNKKGYILQDHVPENFKLENGKKIYNLVCINNDWVNGDQYAIINYEKELIRFFYTKYLSGKETVVEDVQRSAIWIQRWRDIAKNSKNVSCEIPKKKLLPEPLKNKQWQFIRTDKWIMPVSTSKYIDSIHGKYSFCPCSLKTFIRHEKQGRKITPVLPATYKSNLFGGKSLPPLAYKANLIDLNPSKTIRQVEIYLHGSLDPKKWHYGIRDHMLSNTPYSEKKEKQMWENYVQQNINIDLNIFKKCKVKKSSCKDCSYETFEKVNNSIKDLSYFYWEKAVELWESNATKKVNIKRHTNESFYHIDIETWTKVNFTIEDKQLSRHLLLILRGWTYDYRINQKAAFHINMLTFYFKKNFDYKNKLLFQELQNVTKL